MKSKKSTPLKSKSSAATKKKLTKKTPAKKKAAKKIRGESRTYGLSAITSADPTSPFALPVRQPGWFPDGADIGTTKQKRLFLEEVAGIKINNVIETLPVEFNYTGASKKWILGSRISDSEGSFTKFVRRLAVKVRQYNASLYRLRRLHFCWDYKDSEYLLVAFPKPNPHGDPPMPDPDTDPQGFKTMVEGAGFKKLLKEAEADWDKVNNQVNELLETAYSAGNIFEVTLLAVDMLAVNGYIVSMRVVGTLPPPGLLPPETGGSSSQVSISSPFSSSSQIP